jgi:ATP-binding cassette subfamily B protein RaxB
MKLTRLIIAHRPETIAGAQRVVLVRDGQVLELARAVPVTAAATATATATSPAPSPAPTELRA